MANGFACIVNIAAIELIREEQAFTGSVHAARFCRTDQPKTLTCIYGSAADMQRELGPITALRERIAGGRIPIPASPYSGSSKISCSEYYIFTGVNGHLSGNIIALAGEQPDYIIFSITIRCKGIWKNCGVASNYDLKRLILTNCRSRRNHGILFLFTGNTHQYQGAAEY